MTLALVIAECLCLTAERRDTAYGPGVRRDDGSCSAGRFEHSPPLEIRDARSSVP